MLKKALVNPNITYVGGNVDPLGTTWKDDNVSLALSACTNVKNVVERFDTVLGTELPLKRTPLSEHYHLECDDTPLLDNRGAAIYQGLRPILTVHTYT
jgi:hypothetical protein